MGAIRFYRYHTEFYLDKYFYKSYYEYVTVGILTLLFIIVIMY